MNKDRDLTNLDDDKNSSVPLVEEILSQPAPVIHGIRAQILNYTRNAEPVVLTSSGIIVDALGTYANSRMSVRIKGGEANDQLGIQATEKLSIESNKSLRFNGINIGAFEGGSGLTALIVMFNSNASRDSVEAVIHNITFSNESPGNSSITKNRFAIFSYTSGNHDASGLRMIEIRVTSDA